MFIKRSFVEEIASAMEKNLVSEAIEKQAEPETRLVKAAEYLNSVAEIFDEAGLTIQAEVATALLESLAAKKKKKPAKKKTKKAPKKINKKEPNGATKDLTSEKMVENLKEKGWVFNANDEHDANCIDDNCLSCGDDMAYAEDMVDVGEDDHFQDMLKQLRHDPNEQDFEDEYDLMLDEYNPRDKWR